MSGSFDTFDILIAGPEKSGKSALVNRLMNDAYSHKYKATPAVDFSYLYSMDNGLTSLRVIDTSGNARHHLIVKNCFRNIHALVLVVDLSKDISAQEKILKYYLDIYKGQGKQNALIYLLPTKVDVNQPKRGVLKGLQERLQVHSGLTIKRCKPCSSFDNGHGEIRSFFTSVVSDLHAKDKKSPPNLWLESQETLFYGIGSSSGIGLMLGGFMSLFSLEVGKINVLETAFAMGGTATGGGIILLVIGILCYATLQRRATPSQLPMIFPLPAGTLPVGMEMASRGKGMSLVDDAKTPAYQVSQQAFSS